MIRVQNVDKIYAYKKGFFSRMTTQVALKNINLNITDGEIVGILGVNGSGKSTLIKCMTGIIKPTKGNIFVDDLDPFKHRNKLVYKMGVIFSYKSGFIEDLLVKDNFEVFRVMYGLSNTEFQYMFNLIDSYLMISDLLNKQFRKLSFGQRIKCELFSVLLHKPKYIYLDEPTIGLDIFTKEQLYKLLNYFNREYNSTIIITTHELDILDLFCKRIIILDCGKVIADDSPELLKRNIKDYYRIKVEYKSIKDVAKEKKFRDKYQVNEVANNVLELSVFYADESVYKDILEAYYISNIETSTISLKEALKYVYNRKEFGSY
ncbi:MAG: ATP-binding cassette domain-containing protein [bacterium]|nr:ATP-binding cassette domain-containing protein [bacterium]